MELKENTLKTFQRNENVTINVFLAVLLCLFPAKTVPVEQYEEILLLPPTKSSPILRLPLNPGKIILSFKNWKLTEGSIRVWVDRAQGDSLKQLYLKEGSHVGATKPGLFLLS